MNRGGHNSNLPDDLTGPDALTAPDTGPGLPTPPEIDLPPARPARRSGITRPVAPPNAQDDALHDQLVLLLSKLEFQRVQLTAPTGRRRQLAAVQTAVAMMDAVVALAEQPGARLPPEALTSALAQAGEFYTAAQAFLKANEDSALRALLSLFGSGAAAAAERQQQFRDVSATFLGMLGHGLALFRAGLSPGRAASWTQAYEVFLNDLQQVMARLAP